MQHETLVSKQAFASAYLVRICNGMKVSWDDMAFLQGTHVFLGMLFDLLPIAPCGGFTVLSNVGIASASTQLLRLICLPIQWQLLLALCMPFWLNS